VDRVVSTGSFPPPPPPPFLKNKPYFVRLNKYSVFIRIQFGTFHQNQLMDQEDKDELRVVVKWGSKEFNLIFDREHATVRDLKLRVEAETSVNPNRQKFLGLVKGVRPPNDDEKLAALPYFARPRSISATNASLKVTMLGQPDVNIQAIQEAAQELATATATDTQIDDDGNWDSLHLWDDPEVEARLQRRLEMTQLTPLHPPRDGKKCLVLDIDYTLFDLGATAERPEEMARPYLHDFLRRAYIDYDIIIWSATSLKWVEVKMRELGVLGHPDYQITAMMDCSAMVTVYGDTKRGDRGIAGSTSTITRAFNCKPLQYIWRKFPTFYGAHNTIMFDDLRRNFAMNPQQGLRIKAFRHCHTTGKDDDELRKLTNYLELLAPMTSLRLLNHEHWEHYTNKYSGEEGRRIFHRKYDQAAENDRGVRVYSRDEVIEIVRATRKAKRRKTLSGTPGE